MNELEPREIKVETESLPPVEIDKKKWLYAFHLKNEKGILETFYILKPGRMMRQQGEIEYAKKLAFFVKQGLLPKAAWNTILQNLGGTVSEPELQNYVGWRAALWDNEIKLNKLNLKSELSEEEQKEKKELVDKTAEIKEKIQSFELNQIYIFENTAESKARNETILWWLTQMSYVKEGETEPTLFFKGDNLESQLDYYDSFDQSSDRGQFLLKVAKKFNYFITLWFLNRISSYESFAEVDVDKTIEDTSE